MSGKKEDTFIPLGPDFKTTDPVAYDLLVECCMKRGRVLEDGETVMCDMAEVIAAVVWPAWQC